MSIIIIYLFILLYIFIGYFIHNKSLDFIAQDDKNLFSLYNRLSNSIKATLLVLIVIFWLPIVIGEVFISFLSWFAKYYNDIP
jgi:uncharacterized protein YneF (UPF0154 family)